MRLARTVFAAASIVPLAACVTAPAAPAAPPASTVTAAASLDLPAGVSGAAAAGRWWSLYQDPVLDALVTQALANNRELRAAAANLLEARAVLRAAQRERLPQTSLSAGAGYGSTETDQIEAAMLQQPVRTGWRLDLGADVSWEVDLFGRLAHAEQAARADAEAAAAQGDALRVTVAAETTRAYLRVCGLAAEAALARRSVALAEQALHLQERLRDAGAVPPLEAVREAASTEQARAVLPPLEAERVAALRELAVLTGSAADAPDQPAAACEGVPQLAQPLPVGDGRALLRRRPDVREAERRLAASTARIGVATAELYPSIDLGAGIDSSAHDLKGLGQRDAVVWRVGPLLSWRFPNISAARAAIAAAQSREAGELARFDGAVLGALKETGQALARYDGALRRRQDLRQVSARSAEALRLMRLQRAAGAASALELLQVQRDEAAAAEALAQADLAVAGQQVVLFKALGGGWEQAPPLVFPVPVRTASSLTESPLP